MSVSETLDDFIRESREILGNFHKQVEGEEEGSYYYDSALSVAEGYAMALVRRLSEMPLRDSRPSMITDGEENG